MKTILVIREHDVFSRILSENSFEIINLPLIETKICADLSDFEKRLNEIESYDGIFLTSQKAARILAEKLREKEVNFSDKVYVLGRRSFEILEKTNLDLVFDAAANTAREMLEKIALEDLKDKRFLFICGEKSLRIVPEFLAKIASVEETIVYQTEKIAVEIDTKNRLREKFENREIAATCFFSPSQAETFLEQFGTEIAHQTLIATIGKTTAEYFGKQNITVDFVSPKAEANTFAESLSQFLKKYEPDARKISCET